MLTRDVRLEGFTTEDWLRLAEVFRAPRSVLDSEGLQHGEDPPQRARTALEPGTGRRGGVVAVTTGDRLRKLVSTETGRLDVRSESWPVELAVLAARHRVDWAARIETDALSDLMESFAQRLRREHDALEQIWLLLTLFRELESEGRIELFPWKLASWPVPHHRVMVRVFDAVCPDGKAVLFGVFEGRTLFTAVLLRRKGDGFDLVLGPDELRREMGLVSGDFRRDYRYLTRAAEQRGAPLALGCFGEVETFRKLLHSPRPGAWAAAVAARDVIVSPATAAIALPLGVDVGRAAIAVMRDLAGRLGASDWLSQHTSVFSGWQSVRELSGVEGDLRELLGFDPLVLLRKLFWRSSPKESQGEQESTEDDLDRAEAEEE